MERKEHGIHTHKGETKTLQREKRYEKTTKNDWHQLW
jgi:hypothetical protein